MIKSTQISVLCNITKTVFLYFTEEDDLLKKVLATFDLEVDFEEQKLIYSRTVDDKYDIPLEQAKKYYKKSFGVTPLIIPDYDKSYLEGLFEKNFEKTSTYYPLFDCVGYALILEDGRWRLRKK